MHTVCAWQVHIPDSWWGPGLEGVNPEVEAENMADSVIKNAFMQI